MTDLGGWPSSHCKTSERSSSSSSSVTRLVVGGRIPAGTVGFRKRPVRKSNSWGGSSSWQLLLMMRRHRSSVRQKRSTSGRPDALGLKAPAIHPNSRRRKAMVEGKGIHLGGTVKSSGAVRGYRAFAQRGPNMAFMAAGMIWNMAHGTQCSSAMGGSQWWQKSTTIQSGRFARPARNAANGAARPSQAFLTSPSLSGVTSAVDSAPSGSPSTVSASAAAGGGDDRKGSPAPAGAWRGFAAWRGRRRRGPSPRGAWTAGGRGSCGRTPARGTSPRPGRRRRLLPSPTISRSPESSERVLV
ncbi:Os02g0803800 [Oryza sativa Japonica Group]|uniref:Os02g0803800 protein n=2 Tax=Oryza sativa subsp. japonica TaxID=39947 RepID=Q0DWP5_ORYSJ|nr:hypothetical protein EE612_014301 [Oryza sativa]BAD36045.1 unknown protein [Oryza sativa Japonica Group]BAF10343.1 Os02g0803800 [Oryza sativa Japonica Group]BAS81445.1 Os02g0803800 [Oryza sativa Japonica Group]|eukprot:NP_001048429.1 Os02g0803800 [Oryza sativa Japonica Group]